MPVRVNIRRAEAYKLYLFFTAVQAFALTTVFTINLVYQVQQVGLNPLQLVLIGTTLELTAFLMEVPTGVVADVYSRRLSIVLGFFLLGCGFIVEGSLPIFEALLVSQIIMGVGYTFLSGATSAWIVDEIGQQRAGAAFLRAAQVAQIASFAAIFVSVALASISLQLAIIAGGLLLLLLSAVLVVVMPEAGFRRLPANERESWRTLFGTFRAGASLIRSRHILILIMLATVNSWRLQRRIRPTLDCTSAAEFSDCHNWGNLMKSYGLASLARYPCPSRWQRQKLFGDVSICPMAGGSR